MLASNTGFFFSQYSLYCDAGNRHGHKSLVRTVNAIVQIKGEEGRELEV